ncbi:hypothetical protein SLS62_004160 [Diatrype stigma]|uniref:BTB domain-containing protein n=1 Tax=Diatrype stigma TaxID=117547 RepID=A0AAN9URN4_9PEZI
MVSQPDPYPSSLAVRGAQSVVSARSSRPHVSSRSKRYNRSHAGGTSYVPQNEFPVFSHSGDVEIVISAGGVENRYLLHRHTLVRCSGFFEASTSQEWSKASVLPPSPPYDPAPRGRDLARIGEEGTSSSSNSSSSGSNIGANGNRNGNGKGNEVARLEARSPTPRRRWRYELDPGTEGDDIPMLVQKGPESNSASNGTNGSAQTRSLFGGGGGGGSDLSNASTIRNNKPSSPHSHTHTHSHSTTSFFRSVANLSLAPSSRQHDAVGGHSRNNSYHNHHHHHHHYKDHSAADAAALQLSQADADLLRDYDNLFRIFYNYPPVLDGVSIADAYVQCKSLLTLADQYDALAVCGPRVDHHLLQFRGRLWKQVAKYPVSYLRLGYLARSKVIFQEALIHVVGQWPAGERSIRHQLPPAVVDVIEDKVDELEEAVARVEARLFRLSLTNARGDRVAPATGYLDWLAVSLFRQWLADNTSPAPPPPPPRPPPALSSSTTADRDRDRDRRGHGHGHGHGHHVSFSSRDSTSAAAAAAAAVGPRNAVSAPAPASLASVGRTYRLLGSAGGGGGATYLGHDECKRFLKLTPDLYSRDNLRRFEKRVEELKAAAREVVRPLMGSGLELEQELLGGGGGGGGGGAPAAVTSEPHLLGGMGRSGRMSGGGGAGGGGGAVMTTGWGLTSYLTCVRVYDRDLPWDVDGD